MDELLVEFDDIFPEPTKLPLERGRDHRIHLLLGTPAVSVQPYRYPQLLKDELEKQCADMNHTTQPVGVLFAGLSCQEVRWLMSILRRLQGPQ